jgi:hypothetical protein
MNWLESEVFCAIAPLVAQVTMDRATEEWSFLCRPFLDVASSTIS